MLTFVALFFVSSFAFAQGNIASYSIKTMFHCANGKALLEKEMVKVDGVKEVAVDLATKVVTVKCDTTVIKQEGLVAAIEKIGYLTEFSENNKKINKACSHGEGDEEHNH